MVSFESFDLPGAAELGQKSAEQASSAVINLAGNPAVLVVGVVLIIIAILIIVSLKRIIVNSVLGVVAWLILVMIFKIQLPFIPSLVVSIVFGLAGIGVMLLLKFLGLF